MLKIRDLIKEGGVHIQTWCANVCMFLLFPIAARLKP